MTADVAPTRWTTPEVNLRTYYWSGMSNGHHVKGVAIGVSTRMQPSVVEVTLVDERIMRLRLKHCLGFMSVVAMYVPTKVCETEEKETFYAKLDFVLDQCPRRDALIVLGDFNAVTGCDWQFCSPNFVHLILFT